MDNLTLEKTADRLYIWGGISLAVGEFIATYYGGIKIKCIKGSIPLTVEDNRALLNVRNAAGDNVYHVHVAQQDDDWDIPRIVPHGGW